MEKLNSIVKIADFALEKMSAGGATKAQCTAAVTDTLELNAEGGEFSLLRSVERKTEVTMTAFKGDRRGVSTTGSSEPAALEECAGTSVGLSASAKPDPARGMNESGQKSRPQAAPGKAETQALIERMGEFLAHAAEKYPTINLRSVTAKHIGGYEIYGNTFGTEIVSPISLYRVSAMFMARDGDKLSSFSNYSFCCENLDKPFIETGIFAQMLENCSKQVDTHPFGGKKVGTVIVAPQCLDVFMRQMTGAFMSSPAVVSGVSRWRNSIGEAVASESFSLTSAPRDGRICDAGSFTADGFVTENQPVIEKGKLVSLLPDLYTANRTGLARAGSYGGAFIVEGGGQTLEQMISQVEDGILMYRFSGGNPQAAGDFSGIAKNSFIIKDGKIAGAARETTVSGNIAEMLMNIRGLSSERAACGSYVMPYAAFGAITIR